MRFAKSIRAGVLAVTLFGALATFVAGSAAAYPLRAPQVPLQTGLDGISLHTYLSGVGENLNTLTTQLDLPVWQAPASGNSNFTLMMEIAGYASQNNIGIYNAGDASPVKYQVFPGGAGPGWHALCVFSGGLNLSVSLYDNTNALQGVTNYSGVDRNNFGFYLQGPAGTFWSQDFRNAGGKPQVLTYAGTGTYLGRFWECFEDLPYATSDVDFQDSILLLDSLSPTPVHEGTWGALKSLYR